jgi:hypothetical protein
VTPTDAGREAAETSASVRLETSGTPGPSFERLFAYSFVPERGAQDALAGYCAAGGLPIAKARNSARPLDRHPGVVDHPLPSPHHCRYYAQKPDMIFKSKLIAWWC